MWTERLNEKITKIGRAVIELEETRKLLLRLKESALPLAADSISHRIDRISHTVSRLTH